MAEVNKDKKEVVITVDSKKINKLIRLNVDKFGGVYPDYYTANKERLIKELSAAFLEYITNDLLAGL